MYTKTLLIIIIGLVITIYIYYYNNYKSDYNISQTYLDKIDLNLIYEKYPIIIYDRLINPHELLNTLFAYTYTFKHISKIKPVVPTYNKSKHMIIWSQENDILINIINPKYKKQIIWQKKNKFIISTKKLSELHNLQYITIKLKVNQVLILPTFWIFQSNSYVNIIQLNDLISVFISL